MTLFFKSILNFVISGVASISPSSQTVFSSKDLKDKYNFLKLSHKLLDPYALKITKMLQDHSHTTYLVGGCVRDLLCGLEPKDFDISTTARPRQIKKVIKNSYIIGKRFRLVLVRRAEHQYEVSTFRRNLLPHEDPEDMPEGDNIFGSPSQDAFRRDYTCNALFYDPVKQNVIDYTGGLKDMQEGWLQLIGKPEERLPEDPIRILRAVRFSTKLGLQMKSSLLEGLETYAEELKFTALPRRREEWLKLLRLKSPSSAFLRLSDLGIISSCLPSLNDILKDSETQRQFHLHLQDVPYSLRKSLDPAELFGVFIWSLIEALNIEKTEESLIRWVKSDKVQELFKTELGTFKLEVTQIEQALRILPILFNFEEFTRKGARRQEGLLSQKSFPLALTLHSLNPSHTNIYDWLDVYERWVLD